MALAYFSTWTTYGTWLPGDERGWFELDRGAQAPDLMRRFQSLLLQTDDAILLDSRQRMLVETTITAHCTLRGWQLHAVNCRTNHVHVIVTAPGRDIVTPREQFKSWCTRKLKELDRLTNRKPRENWWTERGWDIFLDDDRALFDAITYVREGQ